jgi:hypothetical protein
VFEFNETVRLEKAGKKRGASDACPLNDPTPKQVLITKDRAEIWR